MELSPELAQALDSSGQLQRSSSPPRVLSATLMVTHARWHPSGPRVLLENRVPVQASEAG